ncbi:crossover junction endodeoxyribonuclease RuvC [Patescibacteria group bacterium]
MSKQSLTVLGIDPGLAATGFGVIQKKNTAITCTTYGVITTKAGDPVPKRLETIFLKISKILRTYHPDIVAIEQLFFAKNVKTAFAVGQARGVIFLALAPHTIQLAEYSPLQIKQTVVGYGKADKRQVQKMVRLHLGMRETPSPDDAADALAAGLCWIYHEGGRKKLYEKLSKS